MRGRSFVGSTSVGEDTAFFATAEAILVSGYMPSTSASGGQILLELLYEKK